MPTAVTLSPPTIRRRSSQSLPELLAALFQVPVVVMLQEGAVVSLEKVGDVEPQKAELEAARSSLATGTVVRGGIYPDLVSRFDFWPVRTTGGQNAVIGLAFDPDERPSAPDALVDIVGSVLAWCLTVNMYGLDAMLGLQSAIRAEGRSANYIRCGYCR